MPLRYDDDLAAISGLALERMASANVLSHTHRRQPDVAAQRRMACQWYRYGEDIGWSTATWPIELGSRDLQRLDAQLTALGDAS